MLKAVPVRTAVTEGYPDGLLFLGVSSIYSIFQFCEFEPLQRQLALQCVLAVSGVSEATVDAVIGVRRLAHGHRH